VGVGGWGVTGCGVTEGCGGDETGVADGVIIVGETLDTDVSEDACEEKMNGTALPFCWKSSCHWRSNCCCWRSRL
jgi:hypothetical protein